MAVYKDKRWGTYIVEVTFPDIGRFKRHTGTHSKTTAKGIESMLTVLFQSGRLDLIDLLADAQSGLHLMRAYSQFQNGELLKPRSGEALKIFASLDADGRATGEAIEWLDSFDRSDLHKRDIRWSFNAIAAAYPDIRLDQIPNAVRALRTQWRDRPRKFNKLRSHLQAYLKDTLGQSHPLYKSLIDISTLRERRKEGKPLTAEQLEDVVEKLGVHGSNARAMAITGMTPKEFFLDGWAEHLDRIHIEGKKRDSRRRDVPRIEALPRATCSKDRFTRLMRETKTGHTPYDLRRTFAVMMEHAGIPRIRRKLYMGHRVGTDVTDLYERYEVTSFLREDADRLRKMFAPTVRAEPAETKQRERPTA